MNKKRLRRISNFARVKKQKRIFFLFFFFQIVFQKPNQKKKNFFCFFSAHTCRDPPLFVFSFLEKRGGNSRTKLLEQVVSRAQEIL